MVYHRRMPLATSDTKPDDRELLDRVFRALGDPTRRTIVSQLASGAWRLPFGFTTPLIDLRDRVTEAEVLESHEPLNRIPTRLAHEFRGWRPYGQQPATSVQSLDQEAPSPLSDLEQRFLEAIRSNPGQPSSTYAKTLHLGGTRAKELREALVARGYVRAHSLATSRRGRSSIVLQPLEPPRAGAYLLEE